MRNNMNKEDNELKKINNYLKEFFENWLKFLTDTRIGFNGN